MKETITWQNAAQVLPDNQRLVLTVNQVNAVHKGYYDHAAVHWRGYGGGLVMCPIVFWAELPEGPSGVCP